MPLVKSWLVFPPQTQTRRWVSADWKLSCWKTMFLSLRAVSLFLDHVHGESSELLATMRVSGLWWFEPLMWCWEAEAVGHLVQAKIKARVWGQSCKLKHIWVSWNLCFHFWLRVMKIMLPVIIGSKKTQFLDDKFPTWCIFNCWTAAPFFKISWNSGKAGMEWMKKILTFDYCNNVPCGATPAPGSLTNE